MVDAAFGGIRGSMEYVVFFVLVAWAVVAVWQHRERLEQTTDRALLLAGGLFALAALLLPQLYQNTISFEVRWFPPAMILLLLGLPAPAFDAGLKRLGAVALVGVFSLATTATWLRFDRVEMSGLAQALTALPAGPRVLGLDYVQESPGLKGRPFLQTFAYAQVLHGGELNFSFAEFAPSLVVYKRPRHVQWTGGLEWEPERLKPSDFAYFDYVIVNGDARRQEVMEAMPALTAVTHEGRWRLYRVKPTS
jgi:branched-subunit amino acid transport protein